MQITQCHTTVGFFKSHVLGKYQLDSYADPRRPVVFWGMYPMAQRKLVIHKGFAVVVWRGSDSMKCVGYKGMIRYMQQHADRIKHIAVSNYIENDLRKMGLRYKSLPLTSMGYSQCKPTPRGDRLYFYEPPKGRGLVKYNKELALAVSLKTGIEIQSMSIDKLERSYLISNIYPKCFLGLRLLDHDGLSNTAVELGMCGRNIVYNGSTPNAIHWRDEQDVIEIVREEYARRNEDNKPIADAMAQYINVGCEWLNTKYWEE